MSTVPYRTALVTGASSGLGRGLAAWFARRGVRVYAAARREPQLRALRDEVGPTVEPLVLDVSDADACHDRVRRLDAECGGLELVIANAGVGVETNGRDLDWSGVKRTLDVNVTGAVATLCAALPGMVARGRGHLVGMSSLAAFVALPRNSTYSASKAFLRMWMEGLRYDVEACGVALTCLHPGFVKSELTARNRHRMPFLLETEDAVDRMAQAILRKEPSFSFPWPMKVLVKTAAGLPAAVARAALKRLA
jgi:short-subunit dehydrogenase